jgi:hypothetical protein
VAATMLTRYSNVELAGCAEREVHSGGSSPPAGQVLQMTRPFPASQMRAVPLKQTLDHLESRSTISKALFS